MLELTIEMYPFLDSDLADSLNRNQKSLCSKGPLISKCPFAFIVWTKIPPKNLTNSALEWVGQNLSNFSVVFWSKQ